MKQFDSEFLDFSVCVPVSKVEDLDTELVSLLRSAQAISGIRFSISSARRSKSYELSRGRDGSSSHVKGLAVDILTSDSHTRYKVLLSLAMVGVPRLGVGKNFIHADIDLKKAHPIIFHYYE